MQANVLILAYGLNNELDILESSVLSLQRGSSDVEPVWLGVYFETDGTVFSPVNSNFFL